MFLGLILVAIGAGVIIFNPAVWVIGGYWCWFRHWKYDFWFFSGKVKEDERRKLNQQKENMKNEILPKVNKQEQELITKLKIEVKSKLQDIEKDILSLRLSPSEFSHKEPLLFLFLNFMSSIFFGEGGQKIFLPLQF